MGLPTESALKFRAMFPPTTLPPPPPSRPSLSAVIVAMADVGVTGELETGLPRDDASALELAGLGVGAEAGVAVLTLALGTGEGASTDLRLVLGAGEGVTWRAAQGPSTFFSPVPGVPPIDLRSPQSALACVAGDAAGMATTGWPRTVSSSTPATAVFCA